MNRRFAQKGGARDSARRIAIRRERAARGRGLSLRFGKRVGWVLTNCEPSVK